MLLQCLYFWIHNASNDASRRNRALPSAVEISFMLEYVKFRSHGSHKTKHQPEILLPKYENGIAMLRYIQHPVQYFTVKRVIGNQPASFAISSDTHMTELITHHIYTHNMCYNYINYKCNDLFSEM